jgi:hypothetical protein
VPGRAAQEDGKPSAEQGCLPIAESGWLDYAASVCTFLPSSQNVEVLRDTSMPALGYLVA